MASLKKYNKETHVWETIMTDNSQDILVSDVIKKTDADGSEQITASVHDILQENYNDIQTLKKNVAWLALHGGGGSGGGSSAEGETTIEFMTSDGSKIEPNSNGFYILQWRSTITSIKVSLQSTRASTKYTISASLGGQTVLNETTGQKSGVYTINFPKKFSVDNSNGTVLRFTAVDETFDIVNYAELTLVNSNITISMSKSRTVNRGDVATATIDVIYNVNKVGKYGIYFSKNAFTQSTYEDAVYYEIDVDKIGSNSFSIPLVLTKEIQDFETADPETGLKVKINENKNLLVDANVKVNDIYNIYVMMSDLSASDSYSSITYTTVTVISSEVLVLTTSQNSVYCDIPDTVNKMSTLAINFIAYLYGGNSNIYYITAQQYNGYDTDTDGNKVPKLVGDVYALIGSEGNWRPGLYDTPISEYVTDINSTDFFVSGYTYVLTIHMRDVETSSKQTELSIFIEITEPVGNFIPIKNNKTTIFEYGIFGGASGGASVTAGTWNSANEQYKYGTDTGKISKTKAVYKSYNVGGSSGFSSSGGEYFRYSSSAYALIDVKPIVQIDKSDTSKTEVTVTDTNSILFKSATDTSGKKVICPNEFTLTISYKSDMYVKDDHTILSLGNANEETGYGIIVNVHDYKVKIGNNVLTGVLQDSVKTTLTFVYGEQTYNTDSSGKRIQEYYIKVYQDGVLLNVMAIQEKSSEEQILSNAIPLGNLESFHRLSLGCYYPETANSASRLTNFELYHIAMYSQALNTYDVICNNINAYTRMNLKHDASGNTISFNDDVMTSKTLLNGITRTKVGDNDYTYSCPFFITNADTGEITGEYNYSSWINTTEAIPSPTQTIINSCNIPIVVLDLSASGTDMNKFSAFKQNRADESSISSTAKFYYFEGSTKISSDIDVSIQGTTSKAYPIKNFNISFKYSSTETLFWPREDWFPENTFTLKADFVDSSHSNNASIGKFINDCSDNDVVDKNTAINYFQQHKNDSDYNLPSGVKIKQTLEGFPVLVIAMFAAETGDGTNIKSLGVYSFNLGRDSYYNMGYKILKKFRYHPSTQNYAGQVIDFATTSSIKAPVLLGGVESEDEYDMKAESWEGQYSANCTLQSDATFQIASDSPELTMISDGADNVKKRFCFDGYFWQYNETAVRQLWAPNYPDNPSSGNFLMLNRIIATRTLYSWAGVSLTTSDTYPEYAYDPTEKIMKPTGTKLSVNERGGNDTLENILNTSNAYFYYVICMLTGLVDNLGKNMNMRTWAGGDKTSGSSSSGTTDKDNIDVTNYSQWFCSFYDMDTAFGLNNEGGESIEPDVCDFLIPYSTENTELDKFDLAYGTTKAENDEYSKRRFTVFTNKLWGALNDKATLAEYFQNQPYQCRYAKMWESIRKNVLVDADYFIDNYFDSQLQNCGEVLINQDFTIKYLENSAYLTFLHGNRKNFVKSWIRQRVDFLDSLFKYLSDTIDETTPIFNNSKDFQDTSILKYITISGITTQNTSINYNASMIVKTITQGKNTRYFYVRKNEPKLITIADDSVTKISRALYGCDKIYDIPALKTFSIEYINSPEYSELTDNGGVTELDMKQYNSLEMYESVDFSNSTFIGKNPINFKTLYKVWNPNIDEYHKGISVRPVNIKNINLSNVKINSTDKVFQVDLSGDYQSVYYQNPYSNLETLNISNSDITSVSIPSNISLKSLNVTNSVLTSLSLTGQPLLTNINLTGCKSLSTLYLKDFDNLTSITTPSMQSLTSITLNNCALSTFSYDGGQLKNTSSFTMVLGDCPNLTSVTLKNIATTSGTLTINNCPKITSIVIESVNLPSITLPLSLKKTLRTLSFKGSKIKQILWDGNTTYDNIIDLTSCTYLTGNSGNIYITQNPGVEYIRFDNNSTPVSLKNTLERNSNLKRVYGNIKVTRGDQFYGCSKFSIHGSTIADVTYNGVSVYKDNVVKHPKELGTSVYNNGMVFQSGNEVTNLVMGLSYTKYTGTSNHIGCFSYTSCTLFDVYYVFCKGVIGSMTQPYGLFSYCGNVKVGAYISSGSMIDNSFSKYMFTDASQITQLQSTFINCIYGYLVIKSPTHNSSGTITSDDGLFSPLTKLTNYYYVFGYSTNILCDRFVFRRKSGNYNINSITSFSPEYLFNDLSSLTVTNLIKVYQDPDSLISITGNVTSFFDNLPNLRTSYHLFHRTHYINFSTLYNVPLVTMNVSFNPQYNTGSLAFESVLKSGSDTEYEQISTFKYYSTSSFEGYMVAYIHDSFCLGDTPDGYGKTTLILRPDTFENYPNLVDISSAPVMDHVATKFALGYPFNGASMDKKLYINSSISNKQNILDNFFQNCTQLRNIECLFMDCGVYEIDTATGLVSYHNNSDKPMELPGLMFDNCPNLKSTSFLFWNFANKKSTSNGVETGNQLYFKFKLTGNSFRNCPNIENVSYMFGQKEGVCSSRMTGFIPHHFLYHGDLSTTSVNVQGSNKEYYEETVVSTDKDSLSTSKYTKVRTTSNSVIKESVVISSGDRTQTTITVTYRNVTNIKSSTNSTTGITTVNFRITPVDNVVTVTQVITDTSKVDDLNFDLNTNEYAKITSTSSSTVVYGNYSDKVNVVSVDITYTTPRTNILNVTNLFVEQNIDAYTNYEPEIENCPDYNPLYFIKQNNKWYSTNYNNNRYTFMWEYDGTNLPSKISTQLSGINTVSDANNIMSEYEWLDEIYQYRDSKLISSSASDVYKVLPSSPIKFVNSQFNQLTTTNFAFPPDLLRYCNKNNCTDISYMFYRCGSKTNNDVSYFYNLDGIRSSQQTKDIYGIKGRIVPWMLKPLSNLLKASYLFKDCKGLSYYAEADKLENVTESYLIPKTFFSYAKSINNLEGTFEGLIFPEKIKINVFGSLNGNAMNLRRVFAFCYFLNGATLDKIFSSMKSYTNITYAFCGDQSPTSDKQLPVKYRLRTSTNASDYFYKTTDEKKALAEEDKDPMQAYTSTQGFVNYYTEKPFDSVSNKSLVTLNTPYTMVIGSSDMTYKNIFNSSQALYMDASYAVFAGNSGSIESESKTVNSTDVTRHNYTW